MTNTTAFLETPIFQQIHAELGDLPEIDVHDWDTHGFDFWDQHAFDFLREYDEEKAKAADGDAHKSTTTGTTGKPDKAEPVAIAAASGSRAEGSRRRGRRRKGD